MSDSLDLAQIRFANAQLLFDEFVQQAARKPDAATLRGLEGRFAERLQIQPSYWSQIKGRSRQIGERLARQFERCMHKPFGWMDMRHDAPAATPRGGSGAGASALKQPKPAAPAAEDAAASGTPHTGDERFIVGLVLTYYRRHPERARSRLLDLLGEVLVPTAAPSPRATAPAPAADHDAWQKAAQGVAPLRRKR
ncbi:MAG: hypothetical protein U5L03_14365 [Burkholderiaceae bacterium]|nr:hypothetical protein [Burkholderiaceae bacterium]